MFERKIDTYKNYFWDFIASLDDNAVKKIYYSLDILKTQKRISKKFVEHLREGIYELKAEYESNIYRVFFCFDEGNIVILFTGFQKKTTKTPKIEIEKAILLKKNIMQQSNNYLTSVDDEMDKLYGKVGTPEREQFRREAYSYYMGQILQDARKSEKVTIKELAGRVGVDKSYISKIEKGIIEPGIAMFYRIATELGLSIELNRQIT